MKAKLKKLALCAALFPWTLVVLLPKGIDLAYHAITGGCIGF